MPQSQEGFESWVVLNSAYLSGDDLRIYDIKEIKPLAVHQWSQSWSNTCGISKPIESQECPSWLAAHWEPHSPSASSRISNSNVISPPPFPVVSVIDVFLQHSGLGDLILHNLWSRLAFPQKKTHVKLFLECQQLRSYSAGSFVWMGLPENQKIHTIML